MSDADVESHPPQDRAPRADSVDVRGPDELNACIQLAARWAEQYRPTDADESRQAMLKRFRAVHAFVDAVVHNVEPADIEEP